MIFKKKNVQMILNFQREINLIMYIIEKIKIKYEYSKFMFL
jgi:hypothetical protein